MGDRRERKHPSGITFDEDRMAVVISADLVAGFLEDVSMTSGLDELDQGVLDHVYPGGAPVMASVEDHPIDWSNIQPVFIPAKFVTCTTCEGKGKHVNPSIDSHGLSSEDFDQDPDFREDYFSGVYDVTCNWCGGKRVEMVVDEDTAKDWHLTMFFRIQREESDYQAECAAERRAGC